MTVSLEDWQIELDRYAMSIPYKRPLKPDPVLWELFEQDRSERKSGVLTVCPKCNRTTCGRGQQRPGVIGRALADGTCWSCHQRKGAQKHLVPYTPCKRCHRPLRPSKTTTADYPGTARHGGHGMCNNCHKKLSGRPLDRHAGKKCIDCGRTMRGSNSTIGDYPNTVRHMSKGRCRTCHGKWKEHTNG